MTGRALSGAAILASIGALYLAGAASLTALAVRSWRARRTPTTEHHPT